MNFVYLLILTLFTSCASYLPTPYQPAGENGGFVQYEANGTRMVRFVGNAKTDKDTVMAFAHLKAVDACYVEEKYARFLNYNDISQTGSTLKTRNYSYTTPTTISGTHTSNTQFTPQGAYGVNARTNGSYNATISGGQTYGGSTTYRDYYTIPGVDLGFTCSDNFLFLMVNLDSLPKDDVKHLTKDFLPALSVVSFVEGGLNEGVLKVGDVISKMEDKRVASALELSAKLKKVKDPNKIKLEIFREGKKKTVYVKAIDHTKHFADTNKEVLARTCDMPGAKEALACHDFKKERSIAKEK